MEKPHSQSFLQKRKLLVFLPLVGVPFLAIFFSLLGGGSKAIAGKNNAVSGTIGLNASVPTASEDNKIYTSKIKAYEQVAADSDLRKKNTSFSLLDSDLGGLLTKDTAQHQTPSSPFSSKQGAYNYDLNRSNQEQRIAPEKVAVADAQRELEEAKRLASGNSSPVSGYASANRGGGYGSPSGSSQQVENQTEQLLLKDIEAQKKQRDELVNMLKKKLEQSENQAAQPTDLANAPINERSNQVSTSHTRNRRIIVKLADTEMPLISRLNQKEQKVSLQGTDSVTGEPASRSENGFYSPDKQPNTHVEANVMMAVIHDEQTLFSGSTVKMRLLNTIQVGETTIPKGTFIYGLCSLSDERLKIQIGSIRYREMLLPIHLSVFDVDGIEGLFMPGSLSRTVIKQGASQGIASANFIGTSPSVTSQLAQTAIEAGKSIAAKKAALLRVTLKANHQLLLKPSEE